MFITGVDADTKVALCTLMGIELKELPVRYLGVPPISTRLKYVDCECLKEIMLKRVTN